MKRSSLVAYLCIPALVTIGAFTVALGREPLGMEMLVGYVLGGYMSYAAPYLMWATIAGLGKFSNAVFHAGFIASTIALAAIAILWLFPGDPSGLPLQWILYWPLAAALQFGIAGLTALYGRAKAPNPSINTDAAR